MTGTNGNGNGAKIGTDKVKQGLAQMLKGGVISVCKESGAMNCFSVLCDTMFMAQDVSTAKRRRNICVMLTNMHRFGNKWD
eukprot:scaffold18179_cov78-Skeletonema_dohrnii-CCMP3373.AAC.2